MITYIHRACTSVKNRVLFLVQVTTVVWRVTSLSSPFSKLIFWAGLYFPFQGHPQSCSWCLQESLLWGLSCLLPPVLLLPSSLVFFFPLFYCPLFPTKALCTLKMFPWDSMFFSSRFKFWGVNSTTHSCLQALDGAIKSFRLLKAEKEMKENVLTGQALCKTIRPFTLTGVTIS